MLGKAQRDAELAFEKGQLTKAETDLKQGRVRYRDQQELATVYGGNYIAVSKRLLKKREIRFAGLK